MYITTYVLQLHVACLVIHTELCHVYILGNAGNLISSAPWNCTSKDLYITKQYIIECCDYDNL